MSLDLATLSSSLYNRAATDSAGSALRSLLPGASSLFRADLLSAKRAAATPLPWLVWRSGGVSGASGQMRDMGGSWWVYGTPEDGEYPINRITTALDSLYGITARYAITGAHISISFIGPIRPDEKLGGLLGREVRVTLSQRG